MSNSSVPAAALGLPSATQSRRAILAGIVAAPFAALPVVSGETVTDPIFDLLAARRSALAHHEATAEARNRLEEAWAHEQEQWPNYIEVKVGIGRRRDVKRLYTPVKIYEFYMDYGFGLLQRELAKYDLVKEEMRGTIERAIAKLKKAEAARKAEYNRRGLPAAFDAHSEAGRKLSEADDAVMSARPVTREGALAQLAFILDYLEYDDDQGVRPTLEGILAALRGGAHA